MRKIKNISAFATALFTALLFLSCSDDGTTPGGSTPTGGGWHPNLTFSPGQNFVYTTDSLTPTGTPIRKRTRTSDTIKAQITYQGQLCYPVSGSTYDSVTQQITPEIYWIRYDQSSGKYYQYGIQQLINPGLPGSWDVVGNFDAARGSSYDIATVNYTIPLPQPYGSINFTGPLKGKVADSTTIQTTGTPTQSIKCYRIELTAEITGMYGSIPITATIIVDYYLGFDVPTGIVEIKSRPFAFKIYGIPIQGLEQPGFDRKLFSHNP
jgi:hypothetical protein